MAQIGTQASPLRVAIIGAGPAGFYAAAHLLKQDHVTIEVDLYDKLPTPYGLVRGGVAPDHQKIKNVVRQYAKTASHDNFRFFGNVEFGPDITLGDLKKFYHQICFTTGTQTDRQLGIPGEDLGRSHSATEFVAWYNGHPDYKDLTFDLSQERVAVIGVGNVAVDVARILCRTHEELSKTDIADYALEALQHSNVKEVFMLGRRGPSQAAFTNPEVKELGEMQDADIRVLKEEATLDALSQAHLEANPDRTTRRKVEIIEEFSKKELENKSKTLTIRFLVSPTEIYGDADGNVAGMKLVKNELYKTDSGGLRPRATENTEDLPVGLVFRSVGYRGVPLPDLPFRSDWALIRNEKGRIQDDETHEHIVGLYTAGWIKRGPSGVIGTNKQDAVETVECMLEDLAAEKLNHPEDPDATAAEAFILSQKPEAFSFKDWEHLDALEMEKGSKQGRPRVKFTDVRNMIDAIK